MREREEEPKCLQEEIGNWWPEGSGRGSTAGLCKMHFRLVSKPCSVGIFCNSLPFRFAFPFVHKQRGKEEEENCANRRRQMKNFFSQTVRGRCECERERQREGDKQKKPYFFRLVCFSSRRQENPTSSPAPLIQFEVSETQTAACKAQTANGRGGVVGQEEDEVKQETGKVGKRKLT